MYCRNCGAKLKDTAKFCSSCGTPVVRKNNKEDELSNGEKLNNFDNNINTTEDKAKQEEFISSVKEDKKIESNKNNSNVVNNDRNHQKTLLFEKETTRKSNYNKLFLVVFVAVIAVICVVYYKSLQPLLGDNNIIISGANGYAKVKYEPVTYGDIKWQNEAIYTFEQQNQSKKYYDYKNFINSIKCTYSPSENISNGDIVNVSCEYSKELAKNLNLKLRSTTKKYTVSDLVDYEPINIFKDIKVFDDWYGITTKNESQDELLKSLSFFAYYDGETNYIIQSMINEEYLNSFGYTGMGFDNIKTDESGNYYYYGTIDTNPGYFTSMLGGEKLSSNIRSVLDYEVYKFVEKCEYIIEDIYNNFNSTIDVYNLKSFVDGVVEYEIYTNNEVYSLTFGAELYTDRFANVEVVNCNLGRYQGKAGSDKAIY